MRRGDDESSGDPAAAGSAGGKSDEASGDADCDDAGAWWDSCTASRSIFDCESDLPIQVPDAVYSCRGWDSDLDFCPADESNDCDDAEAWWNTCTENRSIFDCESDLPLQHPDAGSCCDPDDDDAPLFTVFCSVLDALGIV